MNFEFIDIDNITDKEYLLKLLDNNSKTATKMNLEIKKLENAQEKRNNFKKKIKDTEEYEGEEKEKKENHFEEEIDFYLNEIKEAEKEDLDIISRLPVKKKNNYKKIIKRLILESLKNIKDINDFILEDSEELTKEDLETLKQEIIEEKKKIKLMEDYLIPKKEEEKEIEKSNNLIFVKTSYGNTRVLEEIKRIDIENYSYFQELLKSIKDGTFKGIKRFKNNNILDSLLEVRFYLARVVFKRLDNNTYAIITAFIKKTQNDKLYRDSLIKKINDYKNVEEEILEKIKNEDYLFENKLIEEEIFDTLTAEKTLKRVLVK